MSTTHNNHPNYCLLPTNPSELSSINALCLGTGRFLRTVLVPILVEIGQLRPVLLQPRGTSFYDSCVEKCPRKYSHENNQKDLSTSSSSLSYGMHTLQGKKEEDDDDDDDDKKRISKHEIISSDSTVSISYNKKEDSSPFCLLYEIDTVESDGTVHTECIPCFGIISLLSSSSSAVNLNRNNRQEKDKTNGEGWNQVEKLIQAMTHISIIGVGVTEAGLSSVHSPAVQQLATLLCFIYIQMILKQTLTCINPNQKICIINTDNIPNNGQVIQQLMFDYVSSSTNATYLNHLISFQNDYNNEDKLQLEEEEACSGLDSVHGIQSKNSTFLEFLQQHVVFLNTMVDRITSEREGSKGCIPRTEPCPLKALVVEDLYGDLPTSLLHHQQQEQQQVKEYNDLKNNSRGFIIRKQIGQLQTDVQLKLRIANATHTALAHTMALCKLTMTQSLSSSSTSTILLSYLDCLFTNQIKPALLLLQQRIQQQQTYNPTVHDITSVYQDWKRRLIHPYFGLCTFFITQNGASKCGIRLGPTIIDLIHSQQDIHMTTAYAIAAILRFLTPISSTLSEKGSTSSNEESHSNKYIGWLEGSDPANVDISTLDIMNPSSTSSFSSSVMYADQLYYNLKLGWYQFRCSCIITHPYLKPHQTDKTYSKPTRSVIPLPQALGEYACMNPRSWTICESIIRHYLMHKDGCNLSRCFDEGSGEDRNLRYIEESLETLIDMITSLYNRMIDGEGMLCIMHECCDD